MVESGGNTAQLPDGSYIPNPMPEETEVTIYGASPFEFGDMTFEWPGEYYYTISEAAGDAMGFTYDTAIWTAKVTVTDMDGYLVAETTYVSDADAETIEAQAVFTNTYTTNDLKITKSVTGGTADKSKKFKFTVRLFDRNGDPLEGVYPITGDAEGEVVNGVGTVKLAHGETAYVTEIPVEATWVVEEEDYANYTAKCDKDHGVITVDQLSESNWINKAPEKPDTGDTNNVGGYAGLFGTSLMALLAMLFGRRRRREGEE
jgi:pilin isopeptide linkage protein/LPXTG-motif cell wall-anchored protein